MKVAVVQMCMVESLKANLQTIVLSMKEAKDLKADLVVYPEGALDLYIPQYEGLSKESMGITLESEAMHTLCECAKTYDLMVSIGLCLTIEEKLYACNVLISEAGKIISITKKTNIVRAPHFYEQDYFTPGHEGLPVVNTTFGKIGSIVGFDRHFPESNRTLALKGAKLALTPVANETSEDNEMFEWEMRVSAFQNSLFVIMANRVGKEGDMVFSGHSLIIAPDGKVLARGGLHEEILTAHLDLSLCDILKEGKQYLTLYDPSAFF